RLTHLNSEITAIVVIEPVLKDFNQDVVLQEESSPILMITYLDKYIDLEVGDKLTLKGTITLPKKSKFFDRITYLNSRKIFLELNHPKLINNENAGNFINSMINNIRKKISASIESSLNEPKASLSKGLITGDDKNLPEELKENLKSSGLSHITSVSGYNV